MACLGLSGELIESKQLEWKIADFFILPAEKKQYYISPSFVFNSTSLCLIIYPEGNSKAVYGFMSVFLKNASDDCTLHVNNTLRIKKADGTFVGGGSADISLKPFQNSGYEDFYDGTDLVKNKSELVPSGILTIVCILKSNKDGQQAIVKAERVENLHEKQATQTSDHRSLIELGELSEDLGNLSADDDNCDVIVQVQGKEFKAHKAILMARSSVFAAMFKHDTLEKQTGIIKIPDCDSESFQEFLDYLYSGKLEDVSFRSAFHLYSTSIKYDVQKLKEFCIEYLIESLSLDNVCDIVKLADKYDETKLITEAQVFFNENWCKIFITTEWEHFMTNNSRLANKFLVELSKNKSSQ